MQRHWLGLLLVIVLSSAAGPCPSGQSIDPAGAVASTPSDWSLDARYKYSESDHKKFLGWIAAAIRESSASDRGAIIVDKADHCLYLIRGKQLILWYPVELGGYNPFDPKTMIYDGCTPEGVYQVAEIKEGARTKYHRAFLIDYPNAEDRVAYARLRREGRIPPDRSIGGLIEIHGGGTGFGGNNFGRDWTAGCVALADSYMDRLAPHVQVGTRVVIVRYGTRFPDEITPGLPNLYRWNREDHR